MLQISLREEDKAHNKNYSREPRYRGRERSREEEEKEEVEEGDW